MSKNEGPIELHVGKVKTKISFKRLLMIILIVGSFLVFTFTVSFQVNYGSFSCESKPVKIKTDKVSVGVQQAPKK